MNSPLNQYATIKPDFFQELKEDIGEFSGKLVNFVRSLELVRPARFIPSGMRWCGIGRRMADREKIFRVFLLKSECDLPATKVLIENLNSKLNFTNNPKPIGKETNTQNSGVPDEKIKKYSYLSAKIVFADRNNKKSTKSQNILELAQSR